VIRYGLYPAALPAGFPFLKTDTRERPMKLVAEYLERSVHFARLAADADDPNLKERLLEQAAAYRKLAEKRAALLGKPPATKSN
jgi:hypothetical protein